MARGSRSPRRRRPSPAALQHAPRREHQRATRTTSLARQQPGGARTARGRHEQLLRASTAVSWLPSSTSRPLPTAADSLAAERGRTSTQTVASATTTMGRTPPSRGAPTTGQSCISGALFSLSHRRQAQQTQPLLTVSPGHGHGAACSSSDVVRTQHTGGPQPATRSGTGASAAVTRALT